MFLAYDEDSDILEVSLSPSPKRYRGTKEILEGVFMDLDSAETPLALEIFGASHRYDRDALLQVSGSKIWLSLQEAAESVGLSPDTLRTQVNAGRLRAEKKGGVWLTTADWFRDYLASRKYNGKPVELNAALGGRGRKRLPKRRGMKK